MNEPQRSQSERGWAFTRYSRKAHYFVPAAHGVDSLCNNGYRGYTAGLRPVARPVEALKCRKCKQLAMGG